MNWRACSGFFGLKTRIVELDKGVSGPPVNIRNCRSAFSRLDIFIQVYSIIFFHSLFMFSLRRPPVWPFL